MKLWTRRTSRTALLGAAWLLAGCGDVTPPTFVGDDTTQQSDTSEADSTESPTDTSAPDSAAPTITTDSATTSDSSDVDTNVAPARRLTALTLVGAGGAATSDDHRAAITIGPPQPIGLASGPGHRLQLRVLYP